MSKPSLCRNIEDGVKGTWPLIWRVGLALIAGTALFLLVSLTSGCSSDNDGPTGGVIHQECNASSYNFPECCEQDDSSRDCSPECSGTLCECNPRHPSCNECKGNACGRGDDEKPDDSCDNCHNNDDESSDDDSSSDDSSDDSSDSSSDDSSDEDSD